MSSNNPQTPTRVRSTAMPPAPSKKPVARKAAALGNVKRSLTFDGTQTFIIDGPNCVPGDSDTCFTSFEAAWSALTARLMANGGSLKHSTAAECAADFSNHNGAPGFSYRCWEVGHSAGWPTVVGSGNAVIQCQQD